MTFYNYFEPVENLEHNLAKYVPFAGHMSQGKPVAFPKIDVHEVDKETVIHAEIPGVEKEAVKLAVVKDGAAIAISGTNQREEKYKDGHSLVCERHFGSFERTIRLPQGSEPDKAKAKFENGLLTITVPKGDKKACSKIEID